MFFERLNEIVKMVKNHVPTKENSLPDNSYFLPDSSVLCYPRKYGESRYPYYNDGLVMFARSSGYIDINEGMFHVFRTANYNEDAVIGFFAGEKQGEDYFPLSVTGAGKQLFEVESVRRYTVYSPSCVYYIVESGESVYAVRAYVDENKHIRFTMGAINNGEKKEIYLASYFEPMLRYIAAEGFFNRMTKHSKLLPNGSYIMKSLNACYDCLSVRVKSSGDEKEKFSTTAKRTFLGNKGGCLANAISLKNGRPDFTVLNTNTTDLPIASDFYHYELDTGASVRVDYELLVTADELAAECFALGTVDVGASDEALAKTASAEALENSEMKTCFENWDEGRIGAPTFNTFLDYVKRQISLCALGKSYAESMLGIRDVFQQLEASLMWQSEKSRAQIVKVMNYILEDGRPPRQISFPSSEKPIPDMDLRPYIDQGPWIIDTLYTYLAFTGDDSILDEECSYYRVENTLGPVLESKRRDSILEHLCAITDYLVSKITPETGLLRALWGDWNDAIDGIGRTKDEGKEFGSGVSVMASAQLYSTLDKMAKILKMKGNTDKAEKYLEIKEALGKSYIENAVCEELGMKRVLHGWGDKREYYVGSFEDYDGKSRISLTAHAFAAISDITRKYPEIRDAVVENILSLDSKYGLLTFNESFDEIDARIGRISTITPGTYENKAAYVHAGTFGIMALFLLGESRQAWKQLEKSIVITHDNATLTTFVMPNSYCASEEYFIDGVSMGDWYTGSGTVLIKELVRFGFGVDPDLEGLRIAAPVYFPAEKATLEINVKNKRIKVEIFGSGEVQRRIYANGIDITSGYDAQMKTNTAYILNADLADGTVITVK
ncbi:MAG: hypothetical protein IKU52_05295 [Clostridia bacterium]|nr:hypothetical protein [Clostridia bacterium]